MRHGLIGTTMSKSAFIGMIALSIWLQLCLQNLYIACTYANHVPDRSTTITIVFMMALVVTLLFLLLFSPHLKTRYLDIACLAAMTATCILFAVIFLEQSEYRFITTCIFGASAGIFTALLVLLWSLSVEPRKALLNIAAFFLANVIALAVLFLVFAYFGQVIWFDFGRGGRERFFWISLLIACIVLAVVLRPRTIWTDGAAGAGNPAKASATAGTSPSSPAAADSARSTSPWHAGSWQNLMQVDGRLYAGGFLFAFCASLHWEINAMRNGNSFDVTWTWLGLPISANAMSLCYIILSLIVLLVGYLLISRFGERMHPRTMFTIIFYGIGSAFFIPGLLGVSYVSPSGFMMVGMLLFVITAHFFIIRDSGLSDLPLPAIVLPFLALIAIGLGLGLIVSWEISPHVFQSEVFYNTLTGLSLFFVMVAPTLLFKRQNLALASTADSDVDRFSEGCRRLAHDKELSPRESEVLELAARGYSAPAIASGLFISENTVKVHLRHIYEKLGIHTKQELIGCVEEQMSSPSRYYES